MAGIVRVKFAEGFIFWIVGVGSMAASTTGTAGGTYNWTLVCSAVTSEISMAEREAKRCKANLV